MKLEPRKCWVYQDLPADKKAWLDGLVGAIASGDEAIAQELLEAIVEDWFGCYDGGLEQIRKIIKLEGFVKTKTQRNKLLRPGQAAEKFMEVLRS
ncbi:hypothetical protein BI308_23125 [Roseofilum reptotaenium AO1-A]|uniref:Uncharacterized protein n=1 Tax=Roseofilum reptotaenium AO1-A TaxID=1925591 RepID=A0A1L9QKJ1_9CYAN|nr:hypothetical protein BI308_23125 [Roseofilum reptotaenium AO1-A]